MPSKSVASGSRNSISKDARKAFQIEGLEEIQARLAKIINGVTGKEAKQTYYEGGKLLRDQAVYNAPYDPGRKKGTHLRDAIFVSWGDDNKPNVLVGVRYNPKGAPHAHLVEYGTVKMSPSPYFRPAVGQTASVIAATIKNGLQAIIEKYSA